jgi:hypothetical protein
LRTVSTLLLSALLATTVQAADVLVMVQGKLAGIDKKKVEANVSAFLSGLSASYANADKDVNVSSNVITTNGLQALSELWKHNAYDNGTAESGIGINGNPGSYAVQFKLNVADTLRGMQIYFNPVINGANLKLIDLHVWDDSFGKPGKMKDTLGILPTYSGNLNEFNTYWFETPIRVDATTFPGLIFYIGWTQTNGDNLNIGFDRYTNSQEKRFFNVNGNWEMSTDANNYGSVMMRPIIGSANPLNIEKPLAAEQLRIQPNPVTDGNLIIKLPAEWKDISENTLEVKIVSANGSLVYSGGFSNPVNVSGLQPGFYMVLLTDTRSGRKASAKMVIR